MLPGRGLAAVAVTGLNVAIVAFLCPLQGLDAEVHAVTMQSLNKFRLLWQLIC